MLLVQRLDLPRLRLFQAAYMGGPVATARCLSSLDSVHNLVSTSQTRVIWLAFPHRWMIGRKTAYLIQKFQLHVFHREKKLELLL